MLLILLLLLPYDSYLILIMLCLSYLLLEGVLPPASLALFMLKYTLCSVVTDVRQHRHRDYWGGGRGASIWGKQKLLMLNCDPPPEGNAFLEKPDSKVLKAGSAKIKIFDCIRELLRVHGRLLQEHPLQRVLKWLLCGLFPRWEAV